MPRRSTLTPKELAARAKDGTLRVTVVGLGWMGLPIACLYADAGVSVVGADINPRTVGLVNAGKSPLDEPGVQEMLSKAHEGGRMRATANIGQAAAESDVIIIIVPTMLKAAHADYSTVEKACAAVGAGLRRGSLVIFESTCGPGVTERVVRGTLEKASGMIAGESFGLAYSPIRAMSGKSLQDLQKYPRVVGGVNEESLKAASAALSVIVREKMIEVENIQTAELVKLMEVIYRDVNIGLANEFATVCEKFGVDYLKVREAANTQPYSHLHLPGAGVGGHCLKPEEFLFVNDTDSFDAEEMGSYFDKSYSNLDENDKILENGRIPVSNVQVLSFDLNKRQVKYSKVQWLSKRSYVGEMLKISTALGREVTVTPDHPMIIWSGKSFEITPAMRLIPGDIIPISTHFPWRPKNASVVIDLIDEMSKRGLTSGFKVKLAKESFSRHRDVLYPRLKLLGVQNCKIYDCIVRDNYLPLETYLDIERMGKLSFSRNNLLLYSGRGRVTFVPAIIKPDDQFWRLIGYYLSEGCITSDKSLRVRIIFNKSESYLIRDVKRALESLGVKSSESLITNAVHIRVSSKVFGFLFRDVLACGVNSLDKTFPALVFQAGRVAAENVLAGLIRGDGDIVGRKPKEGVNIGFATVSKKMFQQALIIMQGIGLVPSLGQIITKKTKHPAYRARIFGWKQLRSAGWIFTGPPKKRLEKTLSRYERFRNKLRFTPKGNFALVSVKQIEKIPYQGFVYNMEVDDSHTLITSGGIITHNCLPVYSYLLADEIYPKNDHLRLTLGARQINDAAPAHVCDLAADGLLKAGRRLRGARVVVFGITYRADVKELRYSPALELIKLLQARGANVVVFDPLFTGVELKNLRLNGVRHLDMVSGWADCAILAVAHAFLKEDEVLRVARRGGVVVDCCGVLKPGKVEKRGLTYRGVGRGIWQK